MRLVVMGPSAARFLKLTVHGLFSVQVTTIPIPSCTAPSRAPNGTMPAEAAQLGSIRICTSKVEVGLSADAGEGIAPTRADERTKHLDDLRTHASPKTAAPGKSGLSQGALTKSGCQAVADRLGKILFDSRCASDDGVTCAILRVIRLRLPTVHSAYIGKSVGKPHNPH